MIFHLFLVQLLDVDTFIFLMMVTDGLLSIMSKSQFSLRTQFLGTEQLN